jgi:hypothetical protein
VDKAQESGHCLRRNVEVNLHLDLVVGVQV